MAARKTPSTSPRAPARSKSTRAPKVNPRPSRHPTMTVEPAWEPVLAQLRALLADLPGVEEFISWGHPVWKSGAGTKARMFASFGHEGGGTKLGFVADPTERTRLLEDPRFSIPPYVGGKGWLSFQMDHPKDVEWPLVKRLLQVSQWVVDGKIPR